MTPAGFCLFQSEHDESVRDVFWNKLGKLWKEEGVYVFCCTGIWFIWYVCIALVHTLKVHKESDILDCVRLHHEDKLHIVKMSNPRQGVKKTVTVQSIVKNLKIRYGLLSW